MHAHGTHMGQGGLPWKTLSGSEMVALTEEQCLVTSVNMLTSTTTLKWVLLSPSPHYRWENRHRTVNN